MAPQETLARIQERMLVLDSNGDSVGTVKEVYFGTSSDEAKAYTTQTIVGPDGGGIAPDVADPLGTGHELPDMLRRRLLTHGYIRIDTGIGDDYFATADQITGVANDEVRLNAPKQELIH
jgi:hypothetical protein